ncbi:MAG: LCP family protein [Bacilli bacterium]|nr:LCP family protein [Bacilli bacterium]
MKKSSTKTKKTVKRKKKNSFFNKLFSIIYIAIVLTFIFCLCYMNVLPTIANVILIIFLVLISLVLLFFINNVRVRDHIKRKSIVFSLILMIILTLINMPVLKTINFLSRISSSNDEIINYSVLVLSGSDYNKLKELNNQKIGYYVSDERANDKLKIDVKFEKYEDISKLYNALFDKKVSAIIIEDSLKKLAEEENETYLSKTRTIYNYHIKEESTTVAKTVDVTKKPFNIYVSGIDTYGEIASVSRSDVNIVVTVNPSTHQVLLTSIPRDYYVKLHSKNGYRDKLTHAGIYGVDESISTIEDILKIDINYYLKVNFTSVVDIVDALGGVTVSSDYAFTSVEGYKFQKGINNMNGEYALAFVRERYAFAEGDRQRGKNQEAVIKALIGKATSPAILLKYDTILTKLSNKVETNIPQKAILSLVKMQLSNNVEWVVESNNLDGSNSMEYTYSYPNSKLYVMIPSNDSIEKAKARINEVSGDDSE